MIGYPGFGLGFGFRGGLGGGRWPPAGLLKTGQTTQYSSELDDGYYEKGVAKNYLVITTDVLAGTSDIDLAHYAGGAGTIAFDNVAKTIADTGAGLAQFKTNDVILTDAPNNPGPFTVTTGNVAGTITCTGATFVTETPAGAITISKREAHSNNCVLDLNTGLMWSRYVADKMGIASNGKMPWTGQLYDIFAYAAAANVALLGNYADWRIPNDLELANLRDMEQPTAAPNATAFPSWPISDFMWSSTTIPSSTDLVMAVRFSHGGVTTAITSTGYFISLVRGG